MQKNTETLGGKKKKKRKKLYLGYFLTESQLSFFFLWMTPSVSSQASTGQTKSVNAYMDQSTTTLPSNTYIYISSLDF